MANPYWCERHQTALEDDATRGSICPSCDAELHADVRRDWSRFWTWLMKLATFTA